MNQLLSQLKDLRSIKKTVAPLTEDRVEFIEQRLLNRIRFQQYNQTPKSVFVLSFKEFITNLVFPWRLAHSLGTVALVLLLVITLGIGSTVATTMSDPGETFYGVRITLERMPLVLPAPPEVKILKELKFAQNRQREMESIVSSTDSNQDKSKKIKAVARHFSRNIEAAQKQVDEISQQQDDSKVMIAVASAFKESVSDIKKSIDQASLVVAESEIDGEVSEELRKVQDQAAEAELSALGFLIAVSEEVSVQEDSGQQPDILIDEDIQNLPAQEDIELAEVVPATSSADLADQSGGELVNIDIKDQLIEELWAAVDELEMILEAQGAEPTNQSDMILNVEDIIDESLKEQAVRELIEKAKLALEVDELSAALEYIEQARRLLTEF